jgi:3alpha(or 20beta)-hydroxysteroid dehydrogenase
MGRLEDKVVLVTGAARGQGEAAARVFVAEGARVVLGDVLDADGERVAKDLGDAAVYLHHDVTSEASWRRFTGAAQERWGRVDGLLNNAGVLVLAPLLEMTLEQFRRTIDVNLVGCFLGIQAVAPAMQRAGGGSIVNVSSIAGFRSVPRATGYVASKFALRGLTRNAAVELGALGIRVNSIHPGGIDTPMAWQGVGQEGAPQPGLPRDPYSLTPLSRIGEPVEMARLSLFLLSDESSYCTGSEFVADGGLLA